MPYLINNHSFEIMKTDPQLHVRSFMQSMLFLGASFILLLPTSIHGFSSVSLSQCQKYIVAERQICIPTRLYVGAEVEDIDEPSEQSKSRFSRFRRKESDSKKEKSILMTFTGEHAFGTSPLEILQEKGTSLDDASILLDEFFSEQEFRSLLFPKNNATILDGKLNKKMFDIWCSEAKRLGGDEMSGPSVVKEGFSLRLQDSLDEKYQLMRISATLQLPSLQVTSESIIGVKLIISSANRQKNNPFPELQFTLLDSQVIPSGSRAAKWVFNQIMKYRDSTSSFTRLTAKKTGEKIVLTNDAKLGIGIQIPPMIAKVIPSLDVSQYEEQGSLSIQRLLEKDLEPALADFKEKFETFASEKLVKLEVIKQTT